MESKNNPDIYMIFKNESYMIIDCDRGVSLELSSFFCFFVPNYMFHPKYKEKLWDGKIRLFSLQDHSLYCGLINHVIQFCKERNYSYFIDDQLRSKVDTTGIEEYIKKDLVLTNGTKTIEPRDFQSIAFQKAISDRKALILSPTGSGKSLILYLMIRYLIDKNLLIDQNSTKILLIVPSTSLVEQMYSDFDDYSSKDPNFNSETYCHRIYSGKEKDCGYNERVYISTWQSIYKLPPSYFAKFGCVLGDECLHPDTLIETADGASQKKISEMKEGELVKTYNEKTHEIELKPIIKVHKNISHKEKMFKITMDNGNELKITGNHKVLLNSGIWERTDELQVGDDMNVMVGSQKITKIEEIKYEDDTYNLHIKDNHNYFANGVNVSNCHEFKATSLIAILKKCVNARFKVGTTATLDNTETNKLVLQGLFGPIHKAASTKQLIDKNILSKISIEILNLQYSTSFLKAQDSFPGKTDLTYQKEISWLATFEKRNKFIANIPKATKGNTLILFNYVDKQGIPLYEIIKEKYPNRKVFFVSGKIKTEEREIIRKQVEKETDSIIVASYGTFKRGINIKNLHNIIFASPYKSQITILQSIGRGIRKSDNGQILKIYDILDSFFPSTGKIENTKNFAHQHGKERIKLYVKEEFPFVLRPIPL